MYIQCVLFWYVFWDLDYHKSYRLQSRLNEESLREFDVKLIPAFKLKLTFAICWKIWQMSESAF